MVTSLACAGGWLAEDTCIVSYSDIFYGDEAVKSLIDVQAALAITYDPNWLSLWTRRFENPLTDAETFALNQDGTLADIGKTPVSTSEVQGQYMGLLRFTPSGWREFFTIYCELPQAERNSIDMTRMLSKVIQRGEIAISSLPYTGDWGEVDSLEDLEEYNRMTGFEASASETIERERKR
jgi:choline kinase